LYLHVLSAVLLALVPLLAPQWIRRRLGESGSTTASQWLALGGGAAVAAFRTYVERLGRLVLGDTALDHAAWWGPLRTWALGPPLEHLLLLFVFLALMRARRLTLRRDALLVAVFLGAGFASADVALRIAQQPLSAVWALRGLLAPPGAVFCVASWGVALATLRRRRWLYASASWVGAVLLQALLEHLLFERGPGWMVLTLPLLVFMALGADMLATALKGRHLLALPVALGSRLHVTLPEAPSFEEMRDALGDRLHPLRVRWLLFGILVNLGVLLTVLGLGVVLGNRVGIDFARAEEADLAANTALLWLGAWVLLAFPCAGWLVARASGTGYILEAVLAAATVIVASLLLLGGTEPIALVFSLAVAPAAFALGTFGAWWATAGHRHVAFAPSRAPSGGEGVTGAPNSAPPALPPATGPDDSK